MKLLALLLISVLAVSGCTAAVNNVQPPAPAPGPAPGPAPAVKEVAVTAKQFEFIPSTIPVTQGDTVRLRIMSIDVEHGFSLPAFNVNAELMPGKETVVEFVADKQGSFPFICSIVCGTGHPNMKGTLVVQAR